MPSTGTPTYFLIIQVQIYKKTLGKSKQKHTIMSKSANIKLKLLLSNRIKTPLMQAQKQLAGSTDEMKSKLSQLKASHTKTFTAMKNEIPGAGRAMELLTNKYVLGAAAVVGLALAYKKAIGMSLDWEKGMAQINVTAQLSKKELQGLSNELLAIGKRNVAPLEEVPKAFLKIISAGLDANTSLKILEPTLRAAKAGFVDVETVALAGVNAMNASGEDIDKIYDILFETLNKGNAEMGEIASYLPKIIPGAKQAGFALYETAGAFAYMTAQGNNTMSATTMLQGAFKSLSDPTRIANFENMGVKIYDSAGKMRPLTGIIQDLSTQLDGLTDSARAKKLSNLGLDEMSARAFAVMTSDVEKLNDTIATTENSTGALNRAYENAMTSTDVWGLIMNNVKASFIEVGAVFLPIIKGIGTLLLNSGVVNYIKDVLFILGIITVAIVSVVAAVKIWTVIQWALNAALTANPIGLIIVGIAALAAIVVVVTKRFTGWKDTWEAVKTVVVLSANQLVNSFKYSFNQVLYNIQLFQLKIKSFGQYVAELFGNIGRSIKLALTGNFSEAKEMLGKEIKTSASTEIEVLQKKKEAEQLKHKTQKTATSEAMAEAIGKIGIKKRVKDEKEEQATDAQIAASDTSGAPYAYNEAQDTSTAQDTSDSVVGSAKQVRNITVNIDAFNKGGINTENTTLQKMSSEQIGDWFNEQLQRAVRNIETSY